jgi:polysaccharide chain length determinant protein (PEP-CTERM system associated)
MNQTLEAALHDLKALWRYRWPAALAAWAVAILGWTVVWLMPNVYEASARVYVDASSALRPLLQGIAVDAPVDAQLNYVKQQLLSRPALEKVARATDLDLKATTPEDKQAIVDGLTKGITIQLAPIDKNNPDRLYQITYQNSNRKTAIAVVDTLIKTFVENSLGANREGSETAQRFLQDQIKDYEKRLADAEGKLADFKRKNVGLMPGEQGDYFTRVQNEMDAIKKAQAALSIAANKRDTLAHQLRGETPFTPGGNGVPGAAGVTTDTGLRLKEAQARLQEMQLKFTDRHPEIQQLKETISQLEARQKLEIAALQRGDATAAALTGMSANPVYQNIQMQLNQAEVEVNALKGEITDRQTRVAELTRLRDQAPEIEAELARLNRDYGVTKANYDALLERLERAKLTDQASATGTVKFEVIDPPAAKYEPVAPKRALLSTGVLVAALGAGLALAFVLNQLNPVYSSARTLAQVTGLPVLGSVSLTWADAVRATVRREARVYAIAVGVLLVVYGVALLQGLNVGPFGPSSG